VLQVRGFAAQSGAIVHDLAVDLAGCEINETQRLSFKPAAGAAHPQTTLPRDEFWIGASGFISHAAALPAGYRRY
jgi:hypothetical protein